MSAPRSQIVQMTYQNPQATQPLFVPVLVVCNTSDEDLERNVRENAARDLKWIKLEEPHANRAVMVGGGPSVADYVEDIRTLDRGGAHIFAMNGASRWCHERRISVDYQVIADAKEETAVLVDPWAAEHLFASQVHPRCFWWNSENTRLWHLEVGNIERWFPKERIKRGGYALVGGGAAVGNSALALAYTMGYRTFYIFGYDSSHRAGRSHAYPQDMNRFIPCVDVEWAGKTYHSSVAMKAQAEKFQITAQTLKQEGCTLHVYGDGLLPAMYLTKPRDLTEQDKYRLLWQFDTYREVSPGEHAVPTFLEVAKPDGLVIDFGCGTGRAGLEMYKAGHQVLAVDFADNCRDEEALVLPFLEWDLARPIPARAHWGFCSDVMEHIPEGQVNDVLANIMEAAETVFFQISTRPDDLGELIGNKLHLTVKPHFWWMDSFEWIGASVTWSREAEGVSQFLVKRRESNEDGDV